MAMTIDISILMERETRALMEAVDEMPLTGSSPFRPPNRLFGSGSSDCTKLFTDSNMDCGIVNMIHEKSNSARKYHFVSGFLRGSGETSLVAGGYLADLTKGFGPLSAVDIATVVRYLDEKFEERDNQRPLLFWALGYRVACEYAEVKKLNAMAEVEFNG